MVRSPCATSLEHTTDRVCVVGLAMLTDTPVMVDILDAKSAVDSDANFTGEKKRVSKVNVVKSIPFPLADGYHSYCHRLVPLKPVQFIASDSITLTTQ